MHGQINIKIVIVSISIIIIRRSSICAALRQILVYLFVQLTDVGQCDVERCKEGPAKCVMETAVPEITLNSI